VVWLRAVPRREAATDAVAGAALLGVIGVLTRWLRHQIDSEAALYDIAERVHAALLELARREKKRR
jgi:hypothetical protein